LIQSVLVQYRESAGREFHARAVESPNGAQPGSSASSPAQRRDDVDLPEPHGWVWTSDWQV
jgi:hypothetical protein